MIYLVPCTFILFLFEKKKKKEPWVRLACEDVPNCYFFYISFVAFYVKNGQKEYRVDLKGSLPRCDTQTMDKWV